MLGLDGVYVCNHFMPFEEDGQAIDGTMLEGWTSLAALAGRTRRLRLGTLVLSCTHRHPAVVANMAATLDQVTGGRFVLGQGAGGQRNELWHTGWRCRQPAAGWTRSRRRAQSSTPS
jgi:alkanesulfonate monooxygenase SsuD/methylene tetrahydromethanopterin reductase-like flavin-dependent oxidoreductase (luciferase family)